MRLGRRGVAIKRTIRHSYHIWLYPFLGPVNFGTLDVFTCKTEVVIVSAPMWLLYGSNKIMYTK